MKTTDPVAGETMAFICVAVIRGGTKADVVEVKSSSPAGAAVPMPTLPEELIDMSCVKFVPSHVSNANPPGVCPGVVFTKFVSLPPALLFQAIANPSGEDLVVPRYVAGVQMLGSMFPNTSNVPPLPPYTCSGACAIAVPMPMPTVPVVPMVIKT